MAIDNEKRRYLRASVCLPARFSVLIPELTFRPVEQDCEVLDISERGAMVNMRLSQETYSLMLQKTRYCRLELDNVTGLPQRITGRAVWLQPQGNDENRNYKIGLFFEDCPPEIVSALRAYVQALQIPKSGS